ncbi:MAG: serine/threonine-protein phosphatase [Actinobacteria bacterium]|nr:serine/threonine-protein phosphatase [Actinomycetota bacterium]
MNRDLQFSSIAWRSELGLHRQGNEDSGLIATNIIAVADGMGGYAGGEIASKTVIETLNRALPLLENREIDRESREDIFRSSLEDMDQAIREKCEERPELDGMGTTFTAFHLDGNSVALLHIGDSRAYQIRGKKITRLSHDHTVVQELFDQGRISTDEIGDHPQRSFLTQALMGKANINPVLSLFPVEPGDIYLVCSDGLTNVVDEGKILSAFSGDLQSGVNTLINLTYQNDAPDNVTVIAAQIGSERNEITTELIGAAR